MSVAELAQPMVATPTEEEGEKTMTIMEHLQELRLRLAISAGSIVLMMIPGWFLFDPLFAILREPIKAFGPLHYFGPLDAFTLQLKISAVTGTVIALPMLLYQTWAFIAPGLTKKERKGSVPFVLLGLVLFLGGAYTAYRIMPLAMNFLLGFTSQDLQPVLDANKYLSFVGIIMLVFGISFELPLVLLFLCQLDVISSKWLVQKLRYAVFIIFIASMVITPGADPVSPVILGSIMTGLYLLAIVLAKVIGK
ncbi:MAG: twin-arginine translocase subunit TatC [Chloroflexi bacterium]|nr:twin-arginine translocase subunit TatC [Chloroflexota bacterium]